MSSGNDPRKGRISVRGKRKEADSATASAGYSLKDAFDVFFAAKKAEGMREGTLNNEYIPHWRYFTDWLAQAYPEINEIGEVSATVIRDYVNFMTTKTKYSEIEHRKQSGKLSPYTIAFRLRTLRTMFNFLASERIITINPVSNVKQPRIDDEDRATFTDEQVRALISAPDTNTYAGLRDRTLMFLLADSGLRIEEALQLTTEYIDVKSRCINLPAKMNKNRKPRVVPISAEVSRELLTLINENRRYFGDVDGIFLANYGETLKADQFRKRLTLHAKNAGIADSGVKVSPHQFRSYFCTQFLLNGGDLFSLQRIVAHADIETTRRYARINNENMRTQHAQFSPIARLGLTRVNKRK
jgi:integrase/recombinase XerD